MNRRAVKREYKEYVRQWGYNYPVDYNPESDFQALAYNPNAKLSFTTLPGKTDEIPVYEVTSKTEYSKLINKLRKEGIFARVHIVPRITNMTM